MQILITGANGFLGHYLTRLLLEKKHQVIATGKGECRLPFNHVDGFDYYSLDFTNAKKVQDCFEKFNPQIVVHAGAMSKPDECELNREQAFCTNVTGTENLLAAATKHQSFFIFLSTDFIFSGKKGMYREDDEPGPVNYYGQTKLEAEEMVKKYAYSWSIVRTVLVYGKPFAGRDNILSIVSKKLQQGEEYSVVNDQVRTPTYVEDLAGAICAIIDKKAAGVFHIAGADVLTPYEMACQAAAHLKLNAGLIKKVTAADFNQPAIRPLKTGFVIDKARNELGYNPVHFPEGLRKTFAE
jgi:dTDP-4-dehydrorhamnose reductase